MFKGLLVLLILVIVAAGGFLLYDAGVLPFSSDADAGTYQAVFLDNNQVYFGTLSGRDRQFIVLRDIFYLQVSQPIQPVQSENGALPPQPDVNLVKFGGELHGPVDEMRINRDHVVIVEDLRGDSEVVRVIQEYYRTLE
ncbi:hypothetical protein L0Y40_01865 [Candidatus Wolfebacteria bacterium]|nr:hypothetical protein [Candidatus Wolfebacteria bacterium]